MFGIVVSTVTGFVIDGCVIIRDYKTKENEEVVPFEAENGNPVCNMNKPKWDFDKEAWEETEPKEVENEVVDKTKICKSTEELTKENGQLWETVQFLLKQVDMIPKEDEEKEVKAIE